MKIEIELEEVEVLRKELLELKERIKRQDSELSELREYNLIEKAINLSQELTHKCIEKIFIELGFDRGSSSFVGFRYRDHNGKYWWDSEKTEIELGAVATSKMKSAFLKIGFKSIEDMPKGVEIKLPD